MSKEPVIYFTKEDGKNIVLTSTPSLSADQVNLDKRSITHCEQMLGHKLNNLYFFMDGTEFKIPTSWL